MSLWSQASLEKRKLTAKPHGDELRHKVKEN